MPKTGDEWLATSFRPLVEALPDDGAEGDPELRPVRAVVLLGMQGAVDALLATGVLTEDQAEECWAALAPKGLTRERSERVAVSFFSATSAVASTAGPRVEPVLQTVVGVNRVIGLVADEPVLLVSVEVWSHQVLAHLLLTTATPIDHEHLRHPGQGLLWTLTADGASVEGRVTSGHGTGNRYRLALGWDVELGPDCSHLELTITEKDRVVGRTTVDLR